MASFFGYSINKQRVVNLDENERQVAAKVLQAEPSFGVCIGCGTCTATCSVNSFAEFNLRKLMLLVSRGETEKAAKEAEKCMLCGKCALLCPRGVNTRNVLLCISRFTKNET